MTQGSGAKGNMPVPGVWAAQTRAQQGLGPTVDDQRVIASIARMLRSEKEGVGLAGTDRVQGSESNSPRRDQSRGVTVASLPDPLDDDVVEDSLDGGALLLDAERGPQLLERRSFGKKSPQR
jgi:hypothetical protein